MSNANKLFTDVKKDKKELDDVYYGNKTLMTNYNNFSNDLKKDEYEKHTPTLDLIPSDESKFYYNNQEVKQVFKPLSNEGIYRHIIAYYPFQRLYMDTMYKRLENSTLAFINIIDLFSKYAYSKMFLIDKKSSAVKSSQTVNTLQGFIDEIKQYGYEMKDLGMLTLDGGKEFLGDFQTYLNTNKILNTYGNAGDKFKTSPIERFNRTLRLYIERYRVIYGKLDREVLNIILKSYNNTKHAKLEYTPIEILKSKSDQYAIEDHYINMDNENHVNALKDGQSVRVLLDRTPFQKIRPVWSKEIYKVKKIINNGSNYQLSGLDGFYHLYELQPIDDKYLLNAKKVNIIKDEPIDDVKSIPENSYGIIRTPSVINKNVSSVVEPIEHIMKPKKDEHPNLIRTSGRDRKKRDILDL